MKSLNKFNEIYNFIKVNGVDEQTNKGSVGGMWTVWTQCLANYGHDNFRCQLMDEGYTRRLVFPGLIVTCNFKDELNYNLGTENDMEYYYQLILALKDGK